MARHVHGRASEAGGVVADEIPDVADPGRERFVLVAGRERGGDPVPARRSGEPTGSHPAPASIASDEVENRALT
jgi:hypothetical protein